MSPALGAFAACLNPKTFRLVAHTAHCTNTPNAGKPQRSGNQEKQRAVAHTLFDVVARRNVIEHRHHHHRAAPFSWGTHTGTAPAGHNQTTTNNNNPQNRETNIQHHTHTSQWQWPNRQTVLCTLERSARSPLLYKQMRERQQQCALGWLLDRYGSVSRRVDFLLLLRGDDVERWNDEGKFAETKQEC